MKNALFALALLVPAIASAAVKLDLEVCKSEPTSFVFDEQTKSHTISCPESGINSVVTLTKETAESVSFTVVTTKGEEVLDKAEFTTEYNKSVELTCSCDGNETKFVAVATQLSVASAE